MKALFFLLIQVLGILRCNSQGGGVLTSLEGAAYNSIDQTAGGLNNGDLKPQELLIEPVQSHPPGMNPPPPPPPPPQPVDGFSSGGAGNTNQGSNILITYPKLLPTPSGASYPQPGESPTVSVNTGGTVIKQWLPTNVGEFLNGQTPNAFQPVQAPLNPQVPAKQVTNFFGNQAQEATVLDNRGPYVPKTSNPSETKNTAGFYVDSSLSNAGSAPNNAGNDPMSSYFYNEALVDSSLPSRPALNINEASSMQKVKNYLEAEKRVLASAYGIMNQGMPSQGTGPNYNIPSTTEKPNDCEIYQAYPRDETFYMEIVNGKWDIRPCPPGTKYNVTVCSCSDMLPHQSYKDKQCLPVLDARFQGDFSDYAGDTLISPSNVELRDGHAHLNGKNASMVLWEYNGYDFRQKVVIQFEFKPDEHHHPGASQPIINNCPIPRYSDKDNNMRPPSIVIVLAPGGTNLTFVLVTDGHRDPQSLTLPIRRGVWNAATLYYNGSIMYAAVNNITKQIYVKGTIRSSNAPLSIGHCHRYGWFKGDIDNIKMYFQCDPHLVKV